MKHSAGSVCVVKGVPIMYFFVLYDSLHELCIQLIVYADYVV